MPTVLSKLNTPSLCPRGILKVNSIQSFNKYLVDNGYTKDVVVDIAKDRVKLAYGSERQVEVLEEKQVERILFHIQNDEKIIKRKETYEPFTNDDPQNGVAEALAELEYKNELLSLSILGSNVMLNVVMQNDMYNGIPKSGVELKNRSDIEVFDSKKVYKGTLVKTQAGI
ncbi:hypothetical protein [Clostridium botulinum]|uniref:hypothetical protein n=1 Tax=Clostridium botulinum TaxID=1491 RepID=UPI001C9A9E1C|nr:hypothetical protein [Clostridium botulinum]MBY6934814.1 hypothetical protein [Clostridium botulinum]